MSESPWKKEISFGRKPKAASTGAPDPSPAAVQPARPAGTNWNLRELRELVTRRMIDFPQRAGEWEDYLQRLSEYERGGYVPEWFDPLIEDVFALAFAGPGDPGLPEPAPAPSLGEILVSPSAPTRQPSVPTDPLPATLPSQLLEPAQAPLEAAPAEVEPAQAESVPFWKRDLSAGRKPKADAGVAAKPEKVAKAAKAESVPFWKRDLSVGRKPKADTPVAAKPEQIAKATKAESVPFWKRDLSVGRKPKADTPVAAKPEQIANTAKAESAPFWKRELSLGRKPKGEHAAEVEPLKAAKPKSAPFWKLARKPKGEQPLDSAVETAKAAPFWKRDFSLGSKPKTGTSDATKAGTAPFWTRGLAFARASLSREGGASSPKRDLSALRSLTNRGSSKGTAHQTLVGLKIGASQLAAACVENNGSARLKRAVRVRLDEGIVVNGDVREPEALTQALKNFFADQKLPKQGVRLGIASSRVGVRTFTLSGIADEEQLENAIRFRAQEVMPIPLDEAVLDWQVLEENIDDVSGEETRRVLLVVAHRDLVQRYVEACEAAGIRLAGVDLEAFALLRALRTDADPDSSAQVGALVAVNVGHDRSTFAVSDGRICEFTRVLAWGGSALTVAIARALDMTPTQAEPIKHAMSVGNHGAAPDGLGEDKWLAAGEAVQKELQSFVRELVSSLRFYQNQPASLPIAELVLTGGAAQLPGFAGELNRLIGVPVRIGDPLGRVDMDMPREELEDVGSLAVAIGLGIED